MRISGGRSGGLHLKVPKGLAVRPTLDRARQAVFNSLGETVIGAQVLELFAGTGALSLEAISRGARRAVCVEKSPRHTAVLLQNAATAGLSGSLIEVRAQDAFAALAQMRGQGVGFDLILADPPYGEKNTNRRSTSFAQRLLDDPNLPGLLASSGLFVLGHARRDTLELPAPWVERRLLKHGDTLIRILAKSSTA